MSLPYQSLIKTGVFALIGTVIIASCSHQSSLNLTQTDTVQLRSATSQYLTSNPYPAGNHPIQNTPILFPPTDVHASGYPYAPTITPLSPILTKVPGYPYPLTTTPFHPVCLGDYDLNSNVVTTTPTATPNIWFPRDATLTVEEIGNANPDEIVKLLLEKYLAQFKFANTENWQLESYEVYKISITRQNQCVGPNQLWNYWGHLSYAVEPAGDLHNSWWYAGDAREVKPGWISHGTDFILIKTNSYFELKLTGNG